MGVLTCSIERNDVVENDTDTRSDRRSGRIHQITQGHKPSQRQATTRDEGLMLAVILRPIAKTDIK